MTASKLCATGLLSLAAAIPVPAPGGFVHTPHGPWPAECTHEVPSGTLIESLSDGLGKVKHTFPNGTIQVWGPCKRQKWRKLFKQGTAVNDSTAVAHYPAPLYSRPTSTGPMQKFTAKYVVPNDPVSQDAQSIYIWIGSDPDDESNVVQPVLGWNKRGGADPNGPWYGIGGWGMESWLMVPAGHSYYSETVWGLKPGDEVDGLMVADPTVGANGYRIVASAQIAGEPRETSLKVVAPAFEHISTAQFEVWNECADPSCYQVYCDRLPGSQVIVKDMVVYPATQFFSARGLVWDLEERCAWTKQFTQPSVGGPATWTLTPPLQNTRTVVV